MFSGLPEPMGECLHSLKFACFGELGFVQKGFLALLAQCGLEAPES